MHSAQRLGEILGPIVTIANPLDYHTFIWGDGPRTTDVFTTMLDRLRRRHLRHRPAAPGPLRSVVVPARARRHRRGGADHGQAGFPRRLAAGEFRRGPRHRDDGSGRGTADGAGDRARCPQGRADRAGHGRGGGLPALCRRARRGFWTRPTGKAVLDTAGVPIPRGVSGRTLDGGPRESGGADAAPALKGLGFAHKTEAGAVRLGLQTLDGQKRDAGRDRLSRRGNGDRDGCRDPSRPAPRSGLWRDPDPRYGRA